MRAAQFCCFPVLLIIVLACSPAGGGAQPAGTGAPRPSQPAASSPRVETPSEGLRGEGEMSRQESLGTPDGSTAAGTNGDGTSNGTGGGASQSGGTSPTGVDLPENWPSDVPIMDGFVLTVSMDKGEEGLVVGATGEVPVSETADFYKSLKGWAVLSDSSTNPGGSRVARDIVLNQGSLTLNVHIEEAGRSTRLDITVTR